MVTSEQTGIGRQLASVATGVVAALLGLAPWLVTGASLPVQNLWPELPPEVPMALLPLNQYWVIPLLSMFVVAGALGGVLGRGSTATLTSSLGTLCLASVQAFSVLAPTLPGGRATITYLIGLAALVVLGLLFSGGCGWLMTRGRSLRLAGVVLLSVPAAQWLALVLRWLGLAETGHLLLVWLPALIVGLAMGLVENPRREWPVWALGLVSVTVIAPAVDVVQFVAGSRAILSQGGVATIAALGEALGAAVALRGIWPGALLAFAVGWATLLIRRSTRPTT